MKKALTKYNFRVHEVLAFLKAKLNVHVHVANKEQEIRINDPRDFARASV